MLSSELLRTRTSKGKIYPQFCNVDLYDDDDNSRRRSNTDPSNSNNGTSNSSHKTNTTTDKASVEHELASKLISEFETSQKLHRTKGEIHDILSDIEPDYDYKLVRGFRALLERRSSFVIKTAQSSPDVSSSTIRQILFTQSSQAGLATTDAKRKMIIQKTAKLCHISDTDVYDVIWADLDENHILERFDTLSVHDLLLWYNMSLAQTLLFKCTRLNFYIDNDGAHWKNVLRAVKMHGMMYVLEHNPKDHSMRCIIDGPLSIFKLTNKYGTAFAQLLPIITRTPVWDIDATISKKTGDVDRLYRFEISNKTTQKYLRQTINNTHDQNDSQQIYDSSVEQKFAQILHQHLGQNDCLGWRMRREPEPLIAGNKAMLPDFVFERLGCKVYLEIVGFWTADYIKHKIAKLCDMGCFSNNVHDTQNKNDASNPPPPPTVDMLVGIDSALLCSQFSEIRNMPGVFFFDKHISVKPILDHLKKIDSILANNAIDITSITHDDLQDDVILLRDLAVKYMVPENSIRAMIERDAPNLYIKAGPYMISTKKVSSVHAMFDSDISFVDACQIMSDADISDSSHADLLSHLGYDVIWQDLNPNNATIVKKS